MPLHCAHILSQSSPNSCQSEHSLPLASKWLLISNRVRAQQVQSGMEGAHSQRSSFPWACMFSSSLQQSRTVALISCHGSKNRCSAGSLPAKDMRLHSIRPTARTKTGIWEGDHNPSFSCTHTFANQSSATNHIVPKISHCEETPRQPCKTSQHF